MPEVDNGTYAGRQAADALINSGWASRPGFVIALAIGGIATCSVVLALMAPAGVAVSLYDWGLAGYREESAHIVSTHIYRHSRSPDTWEVVVDVGGTQTIDVNHQGLFNQLIPNEAVVVRVVGDRVVAIRVGNRVLSNEDNLPWLIGLPGGIVGFLLLLVVNVRAARAGGLMAAGELVSGPGPGEPLWLLNVIAACVAAILVLGGFSIAVIEWMSGGTPPLPLVAGVLLGFTLVAGILALRTARQLGAQPLRGSRRASRALITAVIAAARAGKWEVEFVGDGRMPKDLVLERLDGSALDRIDGAIEAASRTRPVDVSIAWYPWVGGGRSRRNTMVFNVKHEHGRCVATLDEHPEVTASSETFEGLADAIGKSMPLDVLTDKDVITWDRTLTETGYVEVGADQTAL